MTQQALTIRLQQDWKAGLREVGHKAKSRTYQGEERACPFARIHIDIEMASAA